MNIHFRNNKKAHVYGPPYRWECYITSPRCPVASASGAIAITAFFRALAKFVFHY